VLILGLGAAGALAAQVLTAAGLDVIGVEAGGWTPVADGWWRNCLPTVRRNSHTRAVDERCDRVMVNAVGGSKHLSARQSYRLPAATMSGWPVGADELVGYHRLVERRFRVRPSPPSQWLDLMMSAARGLGWAPFPAPVATAGPVGRRSLGPALRDGRLCLLEAAIACDLIATDEGATVGARVLHRGQQRILRARRVVLSTGTYENVRLLLLSRCPAHPAGCGNSSGQVGKRFATHSFIAVHGLFPERDLRRRHGLPGHAVALAEFDTREPVAAAGGQPGGGSLLQASMGPPPARLRGLSANALVSVGSVWAQPEQLPDSVNRLDLDPTARDALGRQRLRATHRLTTADLQQARFLQERMAQWLQAAGATRIWRSRPRAHTISTHAYGGTCMGADPASSVVDSYGAVHDTPGLIVLGGSTFPTSGGRGPTQTIEALSWRAAERLVSEL
jgi:gluconate 2-dehydrogenase alpha chain